MSTVIKGGTVVTADLSYEADVLVEAASSPRSGQT
jgi:dihydropyrimidinase